VLTPREQGDWGERSAALWLLSQGAPVFIPVGHSPDIDLITILEDRAVRVQGSSSASNLRATTIFSLSLLMAGGGEFRRQPSKGEADSGSAAPSTPPSRSSPARRCRAPNF
jgi:hypothetical protein